jgi:hypothetical protein
MDWYVISFDVDNLPPDQVVQNAFLQEVQNTYFRSGEPEGFAVFSKWRADENDEKSVQDFYLSPVAVAYCTVLHSGKVCEKPAPDGLMLAFGNQSDWRLVE